MIKLKQILEDIVVKNKKTGNVYPVKTFNPKKHEKITNVTKLNKIQPGNKASPNELMKKNTIAKVEIFDLKNPITIEINKKIDANLSYTIDARDEDRWGGAKTKKIACKKLAKTSNIDIKKVIKLVGAWAEVSDDINTELLSIQKNASELFKIPLSKFVNDRIENVKKKNPTILPIMSSNEQKKLLIAMKEDTQDYFKWMGYKPTDKIRLYRGVGLNEKITNGFHPISGNPLDSWTTDKQTAIDFAQGDYEMSSKHGYVITADIEIQDIISSSLTGFGCLLEKEFVVLGVPRTGHWRKER